MKSYPVSILAEAMSGTLIQGGGEVVVTGGVSTDTRSIPASALFFALRGENFDAHDFLNKALTEGAVALVIDQAGRAPAGAVVILVDDVLVALQKLAAWYRLELGIPVMAITGSNGKTSTKDLTRAVLSQKFRVNATKGNLNNHIGLPLSILATSEDDEVGIFEMGMNHPGEIAPLCQIARPDLSIITNVGSAHIENMGSRQAIADEKGEVARALGPRGTLVIPADCEYVEYYRSRTSGRIMTVGNGRGMIRAENPQPGPHGTDFDLVIEGQGKVAATVPVTGRHMVTNALLAAGAGQVLGLSLDEIAAGLASAELTSGRLRRYSHHGVEVIDDTYNANPESMAAAIETLADLPATGRRIACLGQMAELGTHAAAAYEALGQKAVACGLDQLVVVGADAEPMAQSARAAGGETFFFSQPDEAAQWLGESRSAGDLILFKGSRAAAMERVMHAVFPEI